MNLKNPVKKMSQIKIIYTRSIFLFIECDMIYLFPYIEYYMKANYYLDSDNSFEINYVDIKFIALRDILRLVLKGVTYINFREDKPEISWGHRDIL
jgi:hypothetical protein